MKRHIKSTGGSVVVVIAYSKPRTPTNTKGCWNDYSRVRRTEWSSSGRIAWKPLPDEQAGSELAAHQARKKNAKTQGGHPFRDDGLLTTIAADCRFPAVVAPQAALLKLA
jgi:hypothetical protein